MVLLNGQKWAACNVGAQYANADTAGAVTALTVGTSGWKDRYGSFFQWGRNKDVTTGSTTAGPLAADNTPNFITDSPLDTGNWLAVNDPNLWG